MAINIKNQRTVDAIVSLAQRYGTTYTKAVEVACDLALRTPDMTAETASLAKIERLAAEYRDHLPVGHAFDTDDLYDENGLYR